MAGNFLTDWQYRVEFEFVGTAGITDANNAVTNRTSNEGYGAVGRVTWAPWARDNRVVHFQLGYVYREPTNDNSSNTAGPKFATVRFRSKPESNVLWERFVDTGELVDVNDYTVGGAEFAMQWNTLSWQSEYQWTKVARNTARDVKFDGRYSQVAYTLTG